MKHGDAEQTFRKLLGDSLRLTPRQGIVAMLDFYKAIRVTDVDVDSQGDMLLYQWGIYSFGEPESLQVNITRQFVNDESDEPFQLQLTFHFEPTPERRALGHESRWCESPDQLAAFWTFVESSAPFRALADDHTGRVELLYEMC